MNSVRQIKVWDVLVRVFHWSLVTAFVLAYLTEDDWMLLHVNAGYVITGLLVFRLIWGFAGPRHARFADFVFSPRVVFAYSRDMLRGEAPRHLGHNPAGGAMIIVLWSLLLALGGTGWMLDSPQYRDYRPLLEAHAILSDVLLVLIAVHIIGVLLASWRHRENLILAMLTGRKRGPRAGD